MNKLNKNQSQQLSENNVVLYTNKNGNVELRADVKKDTLWASQEQVASLFEVNVRTVNEHLQNIFLSQELERNSTIRKFRIVQHEGARKVTRETKFYNLDAIIAVGYRVNSKKATQFRIWATSILRNYLVTGRALNKHALTTSPEKFIGLDEAVTLLKSSSYPGKLKGSLVLKIKKEVV